MSCRHLNKKTSSFLGMILAALVFLWLQQAVSAEDGQQTLSFSAAAAIAHVRSDAPGSVSLGLLKATRLSLSHVPVLRNRPFRNSQMPELEPVESYGAFFGLNVTLILKGGWDVFSGGDIENGIGGIYDSAADAIGTTGLPILQKKREQNHAGLEFGGDLIYCLTSRLGVGIGMSRINTGKESVLLFEFGGLDYESLRVRPEIKVSVLRLGLFYAFPFAGRLAVTVHGGPALYCAEYDFNLGLSSGAYGLEVVQHGFLPVGLYQEARAKQMGLEGGVGFEFNANPFVAFFLEAQGRYARIDGFEGEEKAVLYQNYRYQEVNSKGPVYLVATDNYSLLDIIPPEGTVGATARKATLDFSGFSFSGGLKLRF
jgi:hypothetical protein